MKNFSGENGYYQNDMNTFVDYIIRKTESNILTINKQQEEISYLKQEIERLKRLEDSYNYINSEIKINAEREANLIIQNAKNNANVIINDALMKAKVLEEERKRTLASLKKYKSETKKSIKQQLDILEDIEIL